MIKDRSIFASWDKNLIGQLCQIDSFGFSQTNKLRFLSPLGLIFLFLLSVIYKALTILVGGIFSKILQLYITSTVPLQQTVHQSFPWTSEICCASSAIYEQIVNLRYSSDQCLLDIAATYLAWYGP